MKSSKLPNKIMLMQFTQAMDSLVKINYLQKNVKRMGLFLLDLIMKQSKKWEIKQQQET
jgi:hypothetical protein